MFACSGSHPVVSLLFYGFSWLRNIGSISSLLTVLHFTRLCWWASLSTQVCASYVVPQEQTRASSSWSSPPRWAQRWALRVSDWLPSRHFYCGLSDEFRVAGPLLPTPNPKWIPSLARGWKESDWVISSSGNSPWQQFKAAWKTGQQVAAIWISKAS